ncbi:MAG: hypothetical protein J4215_05300 [Candidatus Diapherotrites archaeon]|uniref:Uncharacterized protein n=1 Tax=Candidatus Iainarchaeum sp. TaxID=3101447 RepID=A0A8T4LB90_9ARCH|nr:hypothetical protein [Candidatus Diapherotrites archaeon]
MAIQFLKPNCPKCRGTNVVPIVYAEMDSNLRQEVAAGRAIVGGNFYEEGNPDWVCKTCQFKWID